MCAHLECIHRLPLAAALAEAQRTPVLQQAQALQVQRARPRALVHLLQGAHILRQRAAGHLCGDAAVTQCVQRGQRQHWLLCEVPQYHPPHARLHTRSACRGVAAHGRRDQTHPALEAGGAVPQHWCWGSCFPPLRRKSLSCSWRDMVTTARSSVAALLARHPGGPGQRLVLFRPLQFCCTRRGRGGETAGVQRERVPVALGHGQRSGEELRLS